MSQPNLADRLIQELTACRAEGGDCYPIRLDRLIDRLDPTPEPAAVLKSVGSKAFTAGAVVAVKGRMEAPVALREDASALVASPLTLEVILRAKGEKEAPPWTLAKLAQTMPESLRAAFKQSLNRQIEADGLPAFAVRMGKGKSVKFHHRDQPIPPAPEVQDAERLLDLLRDRVAPGGGLPAAELQSAAGLKTTAFNKAVKQPAFADAVIQVKPSDVFLLPNGDEFRRFVTGTLLTRLLRGCKRANAQAFPVKELVALVSGKAQQQSVAGLLNHRDLANDLPAGIGYVLVGAGQGGQNVFFWLEDVRAAKPPARTGAAPEPAAPPVDFVTAFDAAFARLDREKGSNNFVSLVDLRAALSNVPRETFDSELHELRRARRYVLSSDERYDGITLEQQTAAIREEGEFLLHVSRGRS